MTWPIGLARSPARTRSRYAASVSTIPPPVPPSVYAGPDDRRQPDLGQGRVGELVGRSRLDDPARRVGLAEPIEQVAERLAILGHPDRLERGAEEAISWRSKTPASASAVARLSAVCPPSPASSPSGRSLAMTASTASTVSGSR